MYPSPQIIGPVYKLVLDSAAESVICTI